MAMRLRRVNGEWKALCAAQSSEKPGDIYLDDVQDHAIREKIEKDWASEGTVGVFGDRLWVLLVSHEVLSEEVNGDNGCPHRFSDGEWSPEERCKGCKEDTNPARCWMVFLRGEE
jgi:hypothetical protein